MRRIVVPFVAVLIALGVAYLVGSEYMEDSQTANNPAPVDPKAAESVENKPAKAEQFRALVFTSPKSAGDNIDAQRDLAFINLNAEELDGHNIISNDPVKDYEKVQEIDGRRLLKPVKANQPVNTNQLFDAVPRGTLGTVSVSLEEVQHALGSFQGDRMEVDVYAERRQSWTYLATVEGKDDPEKRKGAKVTRTRLASGLTLKVRRISSTESAFTLSGSNSLNDVTQIVRRSSDGTRLRIYPRDAFVEANGQLVCAGNTCVEYLEAGAGSDALLPPPNGIQIPIGKQSKK